jgi:hypothetical protein
MALFSARPRRSSQRSSRRTCPQELSPGFSWLPVLGLNSGVRDCGAPPRCGGRSLATTRDRRSAEPEAVRGPAKPGPAQFSPKWHPGGRRFESGYAITTGCSSARSFLLYSSHWRCQLMVIGRSRETDRRSRWSRRDRADRCRWCLSR